jgi:hypothetical protein
MIVNLLLAFILVILCIYSFFFLHIKNKLNKEIEETEEGFAKAWEKVDNISSELPLGEYYHKMPYSGNYIWERFYRKDIQDDIDNKIKIKWEWISKNKVVYYIDVEDKKKKVEEIHKNEIF